MVECLKEEVCVSVFYCCQAKREWRRDVYILLLAISISQNFHIVSSLM